LINAYSREYSDKLEKNLWQVLVREKNEGAIELFKKAGFNVCPSNDICFKYDPVEGATHHGRSLGRPVKMGCKRGDFHEGH
jgi:hypothetical protein